MLYFLLCTFYKWILSTQKHYLWARKEVTASVSQNYWFCSKADDLLKTNKIGFSESSWFHSGFAFGLLSIFLHWAAGSLLLLPLVIELSEPGEAVVDGCAYIVTNSAFFWFRIMSQHLFIHFCLAVSNITALEICFH